MVQTVGLIPSRMQGSKGIKFPGKSLELKDLILQREDIRDTNDQRILRKRIHKQVTREMRAWKAKLAGQLLEKC